METKNYACVRTSQEGRAYLRMYAAKHRMTMAEALAVLANEALDREEKE